jgi:hypothetical protein
MRVPPLPPKSHAQAANKPSPAASALAAAVAGREALVGAKRAANAANATPRGSLFSLQTPKYSNDAVGAVRPNNTRLVRYEGQPRNGRNAVVTSCNGGALIYHFHAAAGGRIALTGTVVHARQLPQVGVHGNPQYELVVVAPAGDALVPQYAEHPNDWRRCAWRFVGVAEPAVYADELAANARQGIYEHPP